MEKLRLKLLERENEGILRHLKNSDGLTDFFSNDYLGLASNKGLAENIHQKAITLKGKLNGATGSRLLSGNYSLYIETEKYLSVLFNCEKALIFNSGYSANLSILSSIPQKGDTIIFDELIHASLKEGARLGFANRHSFRHNNLDDLEYKIKNGKGDIFVVVESVYSMDGDFAPLEAIISICKKHHAYLIVDEAHSTGIWGEKSNGLLCEKGLESEVFARIYTFGKAMGIHGACVAGSETLIDYLINFARPFIYTTALPPHSIIAIKEAFDFLNKHPQEKEDLNQKIQYFKQKLADLDLGNEFKSSDSPIQVLNISGNDRARGIAQALQKNGFDVRPILSPTVKQGEERLRICLHNFNTEKEIYDLLLSVKTEFEKL